MEKIIDLFDSLAASIKEAKNPGVWVTIRVLDNSEELHTSTIDHDIDKDSFENGATLLGVLANSLREAAQVYDCMGFEIKEDTSESE